MGRPDELEALSAKLVKAAQATKDEAVAMRFAANPESFKRAGVRLSWEIGSHANGYEMFRKRIEAKINEHLPKLITEALEEIIRDAHTARYALPKSVFPEPPQ